MTKSSRLRPPRMLRQVLEAYRHRFTAFYDDPRVRTCGGVQKSRSRCRGVAAAPAFADRRHADRAGSGRGQAASRTEISREPRALSCLRDHRARAGAPARGSSRRMRRSWHSFRTRRSHRITYGSSQRLMGAVFRRGLISTRWPRLFTRSLRGFMACWGIQRTISSSARSGPAKPIRRIFIGTSPSCRA